MVVNALFNLLFEPTILDKMFSYPANSNTHLTDDHAFRPVPAEAGKSLTRHALYFVVIEYGTVFPAVIGTINIFLYASRDALLTAEETSSHLDTPIQIFPFLLPAKTVALKESFLPPVVTLVTLLISNKSSSNSFFTLSLFPGFIDIQIR